MSNAQCVGEMDFKLNSMGTPMMSQLRCAGLFYIVGDRVRRRHRNPHAGTRRKFPSIRTTPYLDAHLLWVSCSLSSECPSLCR